MSSHYVSVSAKKQLADCALPIIRQSANKTGISHDDNLAGAAIRRSKDMAHCGVGPKPCGHTVSYQSKVAGYIKKASCDRVAEIYRAFRPATSVRSMLSFFLHSRSFSQVLLGGSWQDFAVGVRKQKGLLYFSAIFGLRCPGVDVVPFPATPSDLVASSGDQQITISWLPGAGSKAANYIIYLNGEQIATVSGSTFSYTATGLNNGTSYSFYVRARDQYGADSPPSKTISASPGGGVKIEPDSQAPNAPTGLSASPGHQQVALSWTAASDNVGVAGYRILQDGIEVATTTETSYVIAGLANGRDYGFSVVAYDAAGNNSVAASVSATPDLPAPPGTLVWADEFNGPGGAVSTSVWNIMNYCDYWGSLSCNTNRTQNVALDGNGHLRIAAIKEPWIDSGGRTGAWTAARIESKYKFRYGNMRALIQIPAGRGLWPAFWGVTDRRAGDRTYGEYDVMEILGHEPDKSYCSIHGWTDGNSHIFGTTVPFVGSQLADGYHLYEMQWGSNYIIYKLDGNVCRSFTSSSPGVSTWPFDTQGNVILNLAVGGWPGDPDVSTPSPASMYVDWVRVYQ